jgi:hypothetical protein
MTSAYCPYNVLRWVKGLFVMVKNVGYLFGTYLDNIRERSICITRIHKLISFNVSILF